MATSSAGQRVVHAHVGFRPGGFVPAGLLVRAASAAMLTVAMLALSALRPALAQDDATAAAPSTIAAIEPATGDGRHAFQALAGYATAVRFHLEQNPALAVAYITFWNGLTEASAEAGDPAVVPDARWQAIAATGARVSHALQERYGEMPAPYRLADTLTVALDVLSARTPEAGAEASPPDVPEQLLAALDRAVAPRVSVDGRYQYAGDLDAPANLGVSGAVWLACRQSPACVATHDALFAPAMSGVSLDATLDERIKADKALAGSAAAAHIMAASGSLPDGEGTAGGASARGVSNGTNSAFQQAALALANEHWRAIGARLPDDEPGKGTPDGSGPAELAMLLDVGRTTAYLAGSERLATSFGVLRSPIVDLAKLASTGAVSSTFMAATAGVGLLFAGVQAMALFDDGQGSAPPELRALITELQQSSDRNFAAVRTGNLLASNTVDTRLAGLGVALEVIRDDVARIESSQRSRLRAAFQAADARRWAAFDEDNDRCFSLRNIDSSTGRLRASEFRRCEERFLQGAVRRSRYATRSSDYVLDPRFLETADLRFPFHHQYPLLLGLGGADTRTTLALPDPLEWQQHTAGLLRLYQENPASPGDYAKRAEVLVTLRSAGAGMHDALADLVASGADGATKRYRTDLLEQALDRYFGALEALMARVRALDDPAADPYGKRLTRDLLQPLPSGRKRAAIDAKLTDAAGSGPAIASCQDAGDDAFLALAGGLAAESRRFFDEPVTAAELAGAWNRAAVDELGLPLEDRARLTPPRFLWAALDGLGKLEFCLARLRPEQVTFTRDPAPVPGHLEGTATVGAQLEIRFHPAPALVAEADFPTDAATATIARYEGTRSCTFAYRNDNEGCSRARCVTSIVPAIWSEGRADDRLRCEAPPLRDALAENNLVPADIRLSPLEAAIEERYWVGRGDRSTRLEEDVLRSSEYEAAAALYLQYFALARVTLGAAPEALLAPLYSSSGELSPRGVVRALVTERTDTAALRGELDARRRQIGERLVRRGAEATDAEVLRRLPHLRGLRDTLTRVDLLLAAYQ